jgi:hypothetical protein
MKDFREAKPPMKVKRGLVGCNTSRLGRGQEEGSKAEIDALAAHTKTHTRTCTTKMCSLSFSRHGFDSVEPDSCPFLCPCTLHLPPASYMRHRTLTPPQAASFNGCDGEALHENGCSKSNCKCGPVVSRWALT